MRNVELELVGWEAADCELGNLIITLNSKNVIPARITVGAAGERTEKGILGVGDAMVFSLGNGREYEIRLLRLKEQGTAVVRVTEL